MNRQQQHQTATPRGAARLTFRSGAVARMAHLPVATLRIWEQRYQAVRPTTAPSGHRLYSPADVQRVVQLRQLTAQGHAIGAIAGLDSSQLRELADPQECTAAVGGAKTIRPAVALKLIVVGHALAARLQRPAVAQRLSRPAKVIAVFESLAEAAKAGSGTGGDLLIWQLSGLQTSVPPELKAAQSVWHTSQVAVVYRFAGVAARKAFADAGAAVVREPPDDESLGAWLGSLEASLVATTVEPDAPSQPLEDTERLADTPLAPRRFDDAALTAIAGLSPTLACECPRHVAELLMQLSSFEAYSADCLNHSPADAALHAYLQRVAGVSRTMFESALARVARHEGLTLC